MIKENPKMKGSNVIDCIPQTGECPLNCEECFYNGGRFYRTLDEPLIPSLEEAQGKIVRVNSGHDSNLQRDLVIKATEKYKHKFYNTSLPNFNFPGPVVFTCNGKKLLLVNKGLDNVMFVRVRTSIFNIVEVDKAVDFYSKFNVPIVLTFMRYYSEDAIPGEYKKHFVYKKHVTNNYYCHGNNIKMFIMDRYKGLGVRMCGTLSSSRCIDCGNCELLYWRFRGVKDDR